MARTTLRTPRVTGQRDAVGRGDARGQERDRQGDGAADEGGDDGHLERLDERLDGARQERPVRVQQLAR